MPTNNSIDSNIPIEITKGGTGAVTFTADGVLYGNATSAIGVTSAGANGQVLIGNTSAAPSFSSTPTVTSIALSGSTTHGVLLGEGSSAVNSTAAATNGQVLLGSTSNDPGWVTPTSGTGTSVTANATTLSWGLSTPVSVSNGGTGAGTFTTDGVLYGNSTSAVAATAAGTNGQVFLGNTSNPPGWVTPTSGTGTSVTANATTLSWGLSTPVSVSNGGTGAGTFTADGLLYGNTTSAIGATAAGTSGQLLIGNTSNAPGWVTPTATSGGNLAVTSNATTHSYGISAPVTIANGGTNATIMSTTNGVVSFNGTSLISSSTALLNSSNYYTNSSQPCFRSYLSSAASNVTGGGQIYQIIFNSADFNVSSSYSTSTGKFTAPIAGKYFFSATIYLSGLSSSHVGFSYYFTQNSSTAQQATGNPYIQSTGGTLTLSLNTFIQMALNDTLFANLSVTGGTQIVTIASSEGASSFCGFLLA